jgi:hypothetical protein
MDGVAPDRRNLRLAVPDPHPALRATFARGEKERARRNLAARREQLHSAVPNPHPALRATFSRGEKEKSGECEEMDHG